MFNSSRKKEAECILQEIDDVGKMLEQEGASAAQKAQNYLLAKAFAFLYPVILDTFTLLLIFLSSYFTLLISRSLSAFFCG